MTFEEREELKYSKFILERDGLANKITKYLNKPIEKGLQLLPQDAMDKIQHYTNLALQKALNFAIYTLNDKKNNAPNNTTHKLAVTISGGLGGLFGLSSALVELPLTTTLMLRSIAEIAASEGENLDDVHSRMACLEVLALGSLASSNKTPDVSYFSLRFIIAKEISEAIKYIAQKGIIEEGAPILVKIINTVASRFGIAVTHKLAGQALPIIGSISGAAINNIFIDHFQKTAKAHFTIRRLEKKYGTELVQQIYTQLQ